jgi:hypothetical protein
MTIDLAAASAFMTTHARVLDRRRFSVLLGDGDPEQVLAALDAYRNADGGYGLGLEPDLRSPESQPGGALHAFEALLDVAPLTSPRAVELCDWSESVTLPDGGLPFAFPVSDPTGCAPFFVEADPTTSSLLITAAVTAMAQRLSRHDRAVAGHPWLDRATRHCLDAIDAMGGGGPSPHALEVRFALDVLDALVDDRPELDAAIKRVGAVIPAGGSMHVRGGLADEMMRPLDFAPAPDRPARALFAPEIVAADLDRLASLQDEDGGWRIDFATASPAAALEWRGYATVEAVRVLRRNGRLPHR